MSRITSWYRFVSFSEVVNISCLTSKRSIPAVGGVTDKPTKSSSLIHKERNLLHQKRQILSRYLARCLFG